MYMMVFDRRDDSPSLFVRFDKSFLKGIAETNGFPSVHCNSTLFQISPAYLHQHGGFYQQVFFRQRQAAEFNIILVVGIICLVLLIITGIIVVVTLIKRKKNQGLVYNTKDEEIKADNRQEEELSHPLVIRDDANAYDTPNAHPQFYNRQGKPTSPGGHMASPYMVSGLKLPQGETGEVKLPPKKNKKTPVAATESIESVGKDSGNGKTGGRYTKRGEAKGASGGGKGEGDGKEPPTPKKRSIFLTESNEALDKIAEAVAGGKGSGVDGGRAGESRV
ncbi:hypothetical protein RRG08_017238 [Elysia crispata]|uniref:Uncharacterized protein n=1 Tax=Elysia crispata TaxID=231223 RepID=A0AAE0XU79_9GAST|nr:hypothetical protein RRG08_017238 [Elysia crispata]